MARIHVDVSHAGPEDADELLVLWAQAREEFSAVHRAFMTAGVESIRRRLMTGIASGEVDVLLARREGSIVGYALIRTGQFLPLLDTQALTIEQLYVESGARRQGVARALLASITGLAERLGAEQIVSTTPPGAREPQRFLARLGFSPMVIRRTTSTNALRRKLSGEPRSNALEALLNRRRSMRARSNEALEALAAAEALAVPEPQTLISFPVVQASPVRTTLEAPVPGTV